MVSKPPLNLASVLLASLLVSLVVLVGAGCDSDTDGAVRSKKPWRFQSKIAPYSIEVPGEWKKTPSTKINQFADLVLTVDDDFAAGEPFRLIVIPQELPKYEGVPSPDARAIERASLSLLRQRVDGFKVQRKGPLTLDGEAALSVFAEGLDNTKPVQYITSYATHGDFGYQIVAWGPRKQQEGLVQAVDELLSGWTFTDKAPSPEHTGGPEASSDDSNGSDAVQPTPEKPAQP